MTELNDRAAEALRGVRAAARSPTSPASGSSATRYEVAERSGVRHRARRARRCPRSPAPWRPPRRASGRAATPATATSPPRAVDAQRHARGRRRARLRPADGRRAARLPPGRQGRRARGARFARRGALPRADRQGRGGTRGDGLLMEAGARSARLRSLTVSPARVRVVRLRGARRALPDRRLGRDRAPHRLGARLRELAELRRDVPAAQGLQRADRVREPGRRLRRRPDDARRRRGRLPRPRAAALAVLVRRVPALHGARPGDPRRHHGPLRAASAHRHGPLPALAASPSRSRSSSSRARAISRAAPTAEEPLGSAWLALALVPAAGALVVSGTLVTAAGPHSGGEEILRFGNLVNAVHIHIGATAIFGVVFLALLGLLDRRAPPRAASSSRSPAPCSPSSSPRWSSARCSGGRPCPGGSCSST